MDRRWRALSRSWPTPRRAPVRSAARRNSRKECGDCCADLPAIIAVLIPLLFMGDIAGRLFRQFAVTLAVTIVLSAFVSLTLTPMMSARLLRYTPPESRAAFIEPPNAHSKKSLRFMGARSSSFCVTRPSRCWLRRPPWC